MKLMHRDSKDVVMLQKTEVRVSLSLEITSYFPPETISKYHQDKQTELIYYHSIYSY